ncbi:MAG: DJ-1/PfpI family protein [Firmicutes bacterium]|nr:DJ-1/PfpI family protein [Bacillota bacterium]
MKKKAVFIIAKQQFRDEEYQVPKDILSAAGIEVVTASTTTEEAVGKLGLKVRPDLLVAAVKPDDYEAIVFVGGGGAAQYFADTAVHALARQFAEAGKVVAAICIAPVILARAGLLKGKRATVFPDGIPELEKGGAVYTGQSVERDSRIITGNGPAAAEAFGRELVSQITGDGKK